MILEARMQAELLYALRALMRYMTWLVWQQAAKMGLPMYSLCVRAHCLEEPSPHLPTLKWGGRTPPKWGRLTVLLLCDRCCCLRLLGNFRRRVETHRFFNPPLLLYYWWCNVVVFIRTNQCAPFHMFSCTAVLRSFFLCVCVRAYSRPRPGTFLWTHTHFFSTVCFYHFSANCERHCCGHVASKKWCMQIIS